MHAWWIATRTDTEPIGKPWAARPTIAPETPSTTSNTVTAPPGERTSAIDFHKLRRDQLLERYKAMPDKAKKAFKALTVNGDDLDAVEAALGIAEMAEEVIKIPADAVDINGEEHPHAGCTMTADGDCAPTVLEQAQQRMADDNKRAARKPPAEGVTAPEEAIQRVRDRYMMLSDSPRSWIKNLVAEGDASHPWQLKDHPTERRLELYAGVLELAEWGASDYNGLDDIVIWIIRRGLSRFNQAQVTDQTPAGTALGYLTAKQATAFGKVAYQIAHGSIVLTYGDDGKLQPAA
jgi:hypothetical protein